MPDTASKVIRPDEMYERSEFHARMGIHPQTERKWRKAGLPYCKISNHLYFLGSDIIEFAKKMRVSE